MWGCSTWGRIRRLLSVQSLSIHLVVHEQHDTQDIDMKVMELVDVIGTRMRRQLKPMMQASSVGRCSCSEDVAALQSTVAIMQEQIKLLMQERTAKTPSSVESASSSSAVVNALSDRVSTLEGRQSAFQSQMAQLCKSLGTVPTGKNATGKPGGIALPKPLLQELRDEFDQKLAASTVKLETAMNKQMSSAMSSMEQHILNDIGGTRRFKSMTSMQYDDILSLVASETDMGVQNTKQWFEDRCAQEAKHRMGLEARVMGQFDAHAEWLQQLEGLCDTWHASQTHVDALAVKQMMQDTKDVMESVALMESRVLQAGNTGDESKKKVAGLQKLIEKIMRDQGSVESMLQQYVRQYVSVRIRDNNRLLDATLRARIPAYVENEHESFMLVRPNSKQPGGTTKPDHRIITMNAFEFLGSLPGGSVDRLYQDAWACQAVFQSMSPLAQQIVMRLLFTNQGSYSHDAILQWVQDPAQVKMTAAIEKLRHLRVLRMAHGTAEYVLNPVFQDQLKKALSSLGGSPWEAGRHKLPSEKPIAAAELEQYARKRWDAVLHFMVGSTAVAAPPPTVIGILEHTGLMQPSKTDARALHITDTGELLLILPCLLMFHQDTSLCSRTSTLKRGSLFYTTSLAVNLIFGGMLGQTRSSITMSQGLDHLHRPSKSPHLPPPTAAAADAHLLIVVETNFKVYAYTQSSLHIAMLSVFARLPNLAVGFLTRESIRSALSNGISAEQIYDFLMQHAHPKMLGNSPVIPENIADQLYLWQRERNRIKFDAGELVDGFVTTEV
ncbi:hypothetical protein B5M09_012279 [Aphanomyces astaci]|uniref:General transcription factor IIH subunit 4 n=1 Tax=Aphanomyces astaci TaxID=112090 RepID=A0A3R7Y431_APHAT|nr:hypothetical protein B5M09_012279 [Aphanomyces astaci]